FISIFSASHMKNTIDAVNGVLTKANDLRYFVLLGMLVLFLDSSLILYKDFSLVDLSVSDLKDDITIGSILIFICFFLSFCVFRGRLHESFDLWDISTDPLWLDLHF